MTTPRVLELVQALPTSGVRAVAAFDMKEHQYLAIPQLAKDIPGAPSGMNLGDSDISLILHWMSDSLFFVSWPLHPFALERGHTI